MTIEGKIIKGRYYDSVSLMLVAKEAKKLPGIIDVAIVMGTEANKSILFEAGLLIELFKNTSDSDLLIALNTQNQTPEEIKTHWQDLENLLKKSKEKKAGSNSSFAPKSMQSAKELMPKANLALISIAGKYAAAEAMKALQLGMNVMLFSDNVSLEQEIAMKQFAQKNNLLVMGPDCGTAIINGIPLAFANAVKKGSIGIISASGTGLQEVSCILANSGAGVSQAIGTGGRDLKQEVGGITFLQALNLLNNDSQTEIIILISKPPHPSVLEKISAAIKTATKPVVAIFLGANLELVKSTGAIPAQTLEEAALIAINLLNKQEPNSHQNTLQARSNTIKLLAKQETANKQSAQKYVRGLYCGGTFATEAQILLGKKIGNVYANAPILTEYKLKNSWQSCKNTIVDLGEDEFTVGRPHPMIDGSLRNQRILLEAADPEVAVLVLDLILGFGAHPNPEIELVPTIKTAISTAKNSGRNLTVICSVTGTEADPQNKVQIEQELQATGAILLPTNAAATELAGEIISILTLNKGN